MGCNIGTDVSQVKTQFIPNWSFLQKFIEACRRGTNRNKKIIMTAEKESNSYFYLSITHQYELIPKIVRYLVQLPEQQTLQDLTLSIHKLVKYDATEKIFDPTN